MPDGFCARLGHRPMIRCAFQVGEDAYVRDWCACDPAMPMDDDLGGIAGWLTDPLKEWPHPREPITFSGVVRPENEAEAIAFLCASEADDG